MKYTVVLMKSAEQDLADLLEYYFDVLKEPAIGERIYETIFRKIHSLDEMPHRCRIIEQPPYASKGIRRLLVVGHHVFFRIDEERTMVKVLRIVHHRRQWQDILDDTLSTDPHDILQ